MAPCCVQDTILQAAERRAPIDCLICFGSDDDDEFMLSATAARGSSPELREQMQGRLFTVRVGSREASHAQCVARNLNEVLELLELMHCTKA